MENTEKPAFPSTDGQTFENDDLTKREYFAGLAMQGLLANGFQNVAGDHTKLIAHLSISCADELLKQLNKSPNQ